MATGNSLSLATKPPEREAGRYSRSKVDNIVSDLRQKLMLATGESEEDVDARALEDALAAACRGDHSQASALVAEGRVDALVMAEKLVGPAKAGRPDHDTENEVRERDT